MTDANPFDDLGAVESDETDQGAGQGTSESSHEPSVQSEIDAPTEENYPEATQARSTNESATEMSGPAFEYSEVRQRPLYARGDTWDEFEDAVGITVVPELRRRGIRDEEKREIHDAVLTLAAEEPERLVEIIAERRHRS
ncbi:hypothetical protein BG842_06070 [Haladaptatus sp. W1]|uniref:hypothetical protein n=1 Tax=Haladaptatus sp. W1 TaxID=1897478 RepID=UPI000849AB81|nr:hypothetical protein [Haladaptatus sp. W1]ODR79548.1 hypothetical protein BG842_06070 [Haladaptatus sp. W1]